MHIIIIIRSNVSSNCWFFFSALLCEWNVLDVLQYHLCVDQGGGLTLPPYFFLLINSFFSIITAARWYTSNPFIMIIYISAPFYFFVSVSRITHCFFLAAFLFLRLFKRIKYLFTGTVTSFFCLCFERRRQTNILRFKIAFLMQRIILWFFFSCLHDWCVR